MCHLYLKSILFWHCPSGSGLYWIEQKQFLCILSQARLAHLVGTDDSWILINVGVSVLNLYLLGHRNAPLQGAWVFDEQTPVSISVKYITAICHWECQAVRWPKRMAAQTHMTSGRAHRWITGISEWINLYDFIKECTHCCHKQARWKGGNSYKYH